MSEHRYTICVRWTGNTGEGTKAYRSYERSHVITSEGKPPLFGSSDPVFRGDHTKYNPEELLVAALSACHMLWYLHLCAENNIVVTEYEDLPQARMEVDASGSGRFVEAILHPVVVITDTAQIHTATHLHEIAHQKCFIANSVNFPILVKPTIK